ncbi:hypothetical protein PAPHI01_2722 [Pancytospora philotis]|nr:hypothetical protein PAPHI01_2722 [Pancytospora philotis]
MLNIVVNQKHGNRVKATWLDVRKAFDSVDHSYLLKCIERPQMPEWILRFLRSSVTKWEIVLRNGRSEILRVEGRVRSPR